MSKKSSNFAVDFITIKLYVYEKTIIVQHGVAVALRILF